MVLAKEVMNTDGHVIFERRALFFERFGASGAGKYIFSTVSATPPPPTHPSIDPV